AGLARGRGGGLASEGGAEKDPVHPVEGLHDERDGGRPASPEDDRAYRHTFRIVPQLAEDGIVRGRSRETSVRMRGLLGGVAPMAAPQPIDEVLGGLIVTP